jgi:hypothetical protein
MAKATGQPRKRALERRGGTSASRLRGGAFALSFQLQKLASLHGFPRSIWRSFVEGPSLKTHMTKEYWIL